MPTYGEQSNERAVQRIINQSWTPLRQFMLSQQGQAALRAGGADALLRSLPMDQWFQNMGDVQEPLYRQVGNRVRADSKQFSALKAGLSFDVIDRISVRYASSQATSLIRNMDESLRATLRVILGEAMNGRYTVDTAARAIARVVPLHPAWTEAVIKHGDRVYQSSLKDGARQVDAILRADKQMDSYAARLTRARARNIARTEIQVASNLGQYASWEHAIGGGYAGRNSQKEWSPGPGACGICSELSGETVGWDEPFSNGGMMPPAHPGCRCTANLIPENTVAAPIDWLSPSLYKEKA